MAFLIHLTLFSSHGLTETPFSINLVLLLCKFEKYYMNRVQRRR